MKGISVRIIQSLPDYPGNVELRQVEEVVIVRLPFTVYYRRGRVHARERVCVCVLGGRAHV